MKNSFQKEIKGTHKNKYRTLAGYYITAKQVKDIKKEHPLVRIPAELKAK